MLTLPLKTKVCCVAIAQALGTATNWDHIHRTCEVTPSDTLELEWVAPAGLGFLYNNLSSTEIFQVLCSSAGGATLTGDTDGLCGEISVGDLASCGGFPGTAYKAIPAPPPPPQPPIFVGLNWPQLFTVTVASAGASAVVISTTIALIRRPINAS